MKPRIYRLDGMWFCFGAYTVGFGRDPSEAFGMWQRNNELMGRLAELERMLDTGINVAFTRH